VSFVKICDISVSELTDIFVFESNGLFGSDGL